MPCAAGTPQGGVISPLLANVFLHYAFDMWMVRTFPHIPFERYADDAICHCRSADEAQALWSAIVDRFATCRLVLHPQKTKIVYCKDVNRRGDFPDIHFDFLGFQFRARKIMWVKPDGRIFSHSFQPAASPKALYAHQPRDTQLGAASPERQISDRTCPDVQPVHSWLDHLLQPLLQDAIASDPEADRCLRHPAGTSKASDCATRPRAQEIGLTGYAGPTPRSSHIGRYVMATAEHREPCDSRGSCTVLGAPGGEIPPGDSSRAAVAGRRMALPIYPQLRKYPCVPALTLRANERLMHRSKPHVTRLAPRRGVASFIDLMLPISFKPLLKYLRRCSLVNFGKLLERKRGDYTHNIGIDGL
jgi:Reverse transcriptase (RNA-dependent DNA polymerase)